MLRPFRPVCLPPFPELDEEPQNRLNAAQGKATAVDMSEADGLTIDDR